MPVEPSEQPRQEAQPGPGAGAEGAAAPQDTKEPARAAEHAPENSDAAAGSGATQTQSATEISDTVVAATSPAQPTAPALADTTPADAANVAKTEFVPLPPKSAEANQAAPTDDWRPSQSPEATAQAAQAQPQPPQPAQPSQNPQISAPIPTTPASALPQVQPPAQTGSLPPTQPAAPQQQDPQQQYPQQYPQQPYPQQPPHPTFPLPTAGPGDVLSPPPGAAAAAAAAQPLYPAAPPPYPASQQPAPPYQGAPPVPPGTPMQQQQPWAWGQQQPYGAYPPPQAQVPSPYPPPPPGWPQPPLAQTQPEGPSLTQSMPPPTQPQPPQAPQTAPQPQMPAQPQADPQQQQQPSYSYPYASNSGSWEQQQQVAWAQGQQPGYPPAPAATGRSKTRLWLMIGVPVLVMIIVAAVVVALTQSSTPSAAVSKVTCRPQSLAGCLVEAPPAASKYATDWGSTTTVTAKDYVAQYADSAEQTEPQDATMVGTDGEKSIVHRNWYVGGDQVDIILLEFATPQGAQSWGLDRSANFMAQFRGSPITVTGDSSTQAYAAASTDSSGDIDVGYATVVGTTVLEVHYASHGSLDKTNFENWASTEYASLQTAPAVTASPSPSATSSQNTTCPGAMSNCLMPRPAGYSPWTDPSHNATYSISGYTSQFTYANSSGQQQYEDLMTTDGVVSINDEDWLSVGDGAEGWLALIQTRSDQGAQDLLSKEGGSVSVRPQTFTVSGFSNAVGSYSTSADSAGLFDGMVAAQVGTVYMEMWLDFANSYNVGTSQAWAIEELTLLTQNTSNLGIPIPQVTTPTLSAPSPATCAAGADGCLMAVPGGATSTTSSSYETNTDLSVNSYVNQYFPSSETYKGTWLNADGATGASHETWVAGNGADADDILLHFGSPQEAQAAAHKLAGDQMEGTQSCSVSNVKNAYCLVQPQDVESGSVPISILAWKGGYVMDLEISQVGSADTADALNWALQQLAELPGS
jgi:hypothetical protein